MALAASTVLAARPRAARAQGSPDVTSLPVAFSADELHLDTRSQALDANGDVRVDEPPFHLTSDALQLRRVPIGVELDGEGKLAFCPCLGAPLTVRFTGATIAPPHDLILRNPVLEVFGVPVAWAPAFWLRSPGRLGLLPPDLAWRGADGFFAGGGVHVPWRSGDVLHGFDLRAGAYFDGGAVVDGVVRTSATETHVRWDDLRGNDGVSIQAHGATAIANGDRADSVAWDVDALRGTRAVQATSDLDAAARPFDRATAQAAWRSDGWVIGSQVRAVALRGSFVLDDGVAGPVLDVRRAGAIGSVGAYDATIEGGQVAGGGFGATSFARAEGGALVATRLGALGASLALRGLGDVADDGLRDGVDGVAQVAGGRRFAAGERVRVRGRGRPVDSPDRASAGGGPGRGAYGRGARRPGRPRGSGRDRRRQGMDRRAGLVESGGPDRLAGRRSTSTWRAVPSATTAAGSGRCSGPVRR